MPAVQPPAKVLVTGASGFIAAWTVKKFLEAGFTVIGTVRSPSKGDYLKNLFKNEPYSDNFSYVIVGDIAEPGAFDEAVKGVDAVAHTASPWHLTGKDPKDYYEPALKGTVGILESVVKNAPSVKRVVITSSVASILDPNKPEGYVFTENDWNTASPKAVEEKGAAAGPADMYMGSKVLAERAAFDFVNDKSNGAKFDLTTILPPFVFGPTIHEVSSKASLNTSVAIFNARLLDKSSQSTEDDFLVTPGSWIDVRDVADAHVQAVLAPKAGGERYVISAGGFTFQDFAVALADSPLADKSNNPFPGKPNREANPRYSSGAKAAKSFEEGGLGIKYIGLKESVVDTARSIIDRFDFVDHHPVTQPRGAGPFCGVFTSADPSHPLTGIAFKGTTWYNFEEWLVDFNYDLVSVANNLVPDTLISSNVNGSLFGAFSSLAPPDTSPFDLITQAIGAHIVSLPATNVSTVAHVTGHSLGASYATAAYAGVLFTKFPGNWFLGDLYTFGSPRIGDKAFGEKIKNTVALKPNGSTWRIVNHLDPFTEVPPAFEKDLLDFYHIDSGITIFPRQQPEQITSELGLARGPARVPLWKLIPRIPHHMPPVYWEAFCTAGNIPPSPKSEK